MPAWPRSRTQVLDGSGRPFLDLAVNFFVGGTTTPLVVFSDPARTQPRTQPVVADANGRFPAVYLSDGLYAEQVLGTGGAELWYDDGLGEAVPDVSTVEPIVIPPAAAYFGTGDVKWRPDGGILPGWVRMNGNAIGNASSGASERAHADTLGLFTYLYNNFNDGIAPVIGGRGNAGAAADYSLGKSITIPSMQGLVAAGLDDMGAAPVNRLQAVRSVFLTPGQAQASVSDANGLAIGMFIFAPNVSYGTTITAITGNTISLSTAPAPPAPGAFTARFGFLDALAPASFGGSALGFVSRSQLPVAMPGGTAVYDDPADVEKTYSVLQTLRYGDGGTATTVSGIWQNVQDTVTDLPPVSLQVNIDNPGGGQPFSNLPPMRLGTYYMKL